MSLLIQIFEDHGAGPTAAEVNNVGWKSSIADETYLYADYPIARPDGINTLYTTSAVKYNYAKISGTYANATRVRFKLTGDVSGAAPAGYDGTNKVRLYYKLTNTYSNAAYDDQFLLSGSYIIPGQTLILAPFLSTTGPDAATDFVNLLSANTTYYTNYLATQLYVEQGAWNEFGNIGEFTIQFMVDEMDGSL